MCGCHLARIGSEARIPYSCQPTGGCDEATEESLRLYWWDEDAEQWLAAGNPSNLVDNSGDPAYAGFVLGEPTGVLGDWGVDPSHHVVWANLDHGSTFSVASVPEPATATLWLRAASCSDSGSGEEGTCGRVNCGKKRGNGSDFQELNRLLSYEGRRTPQR